MSRITQAQLADQLASLTALVQGLLADRGTPSPGMQVTLEPPKAAPAPAQTGIAIPVRAGATPAAPKGPREMTKPLSARECSRWVTVDGVAGATAFNVPDPTKGVKGSVITRLGGQARETRTDWRVDAYDPSSNKVTLVEVLA